jgi:hypothetical protein
MSITLASARDNQRTPLLLGEASDASAPPPSQKSPTEARTLALRFFLMATFFSINHGTVTGFHTIKTTEQDL